MSTQIQITNQIPVYIQLACSDEVTALTTGAATVASIASGGLFAYTKNSGFNFEGVNFSIINNTTFDTTVSNTLVITAQWNTNNAGNSIYSEIFTLHKTY
jgi:hypothetical protein